MQKFIIEGLFPNGTQVWARMERGVIRWRPGYNQATAFDEPEAELVLRNYTVARAKRTAKDQHRSEISG